MQAGVKTGVKAIRIRRKKSLSGSKKGSKNFLAPKKLLWSRQGRGGGQGTNFLAPEFSELFQMNVSFFSPGRGGQGRGQGVRFDRFDNIPFDSIDIACEGHGGPP